MGFREPCLALFISLMVPTACESRAIPEEPRRGGACGNALCTTFVLVEEELSTMDGGLGMVGNVASLSANFSALALASSSTCNLALTSTSCHNLALFCRGAGLR